MIPLTRETLWIPKILQTLRLSLMLFPTGFLFILLHAYTTSSYLPPVSSLPFRVQEVEKLNNDLQVKYQSVVELNLHLEDGASHKQVNMIDQMRNTMRAEMDQGFTKMSAGMEFRMNRY